MEKWQEFLLTKERNSHKGYIRSLSVVLKEDGVTRLTKRADISIIYWCVAVYALYVLWYYVRILLHTVLVCVSLISQKSNELSIGRNRIQQTWIKESYITLPCLLKVPKLNQSLVYVRIFPLLISLPTPIYAIVSVQARSFGSAEYRCKLVSLIERECMQLNEKTNLSSMKTRE